MVSNPSDPLKPTHLSQMIGNQQAINRLEKAVKDCTPVLIYGDPGIGKTTSVQLLAKKLNLTLVEINASDEKRAEDLAHIKNLAHSKGLLKYLIFFDEIDVGTKISQAALEDIVLRSAHPVVFAANDYYKVPDIIRKNCEVIRYNKPSTSDILTYIKTRLPNANINYTQINGDVRSAFTIALYGSQPAVTPDDKQLIEAIFHGKEQLTDTRQVYWLLDNAVNKYYGLSLVTFLDLLALCDRIGRYEPLSLLTPNRRGAITYPHFLTKSRGGSNDPQYS